MWCCQSFAVGRSQELLILMYRNGLIDRTFVDGMARAATKIVLRNKGFVDNWEWLNSAVARATFVEAQTDRVEALRSPSVIITTAGMMNGGPVVDYITRLNQKSGILLTRIPGGRNERQDPAGEGNGKDRRQREEGTHVKSSYCDLSAHAGKAELYDYVKGCEPSNGDLRPRRPRSGVDTWPSR